MHSDDVKFIITSKSEKASTLTIRLDSEIISILDEISSKSNRSRNEIINKALEFALNNLEFIHNLYKF